MPLTLGFAGLYTNANQLSNVPAGAARVALNIVSDEPGKATCRPGQGPMSGSYATADERLHSGVEYEGFNIEHTGVSLYRRAMPGGAVTKIADVQSASGTRMWPVVAGDDLYLPTSQGVMVMDGANATPVVAGRLPMPDLGGAAMVTTGAVWLTTGRSVAYRSVHIKSDAQGRLQQGPPSGRQAVKNTEADTRTPFVSVYLPPDAVAGDFIQLYRTTSVASGAEPGDVMYLAKEFPITQDDVDQGSLAVHDFAPDTQLGQPLYTNATQSGITMANNAPGLAKTAALYGQSLFLGDTTAKHQMLISVIAAPTSGSVLYVNGEALLILYNTTGSVAGDIEAWSRTVASQLAQNYNAYIGVRAYYVSGENDPPGRLLFQANTITASAFTVQQASGVNFVPDITSAVSSTQDVRRNGIDISKPGLPYAFPSNTSFHLRLGAANKRILRLVANRDSLFAFKEDGIWRIYQSGDAWGYQQISTDVVLQFPDSVAVLDNQIYGVTNRDVVAVDESGIEEAAKQVGNLVDVVRDINLSTALSAPGVFAVADTTRLRYYLWYPEATDDTPTHALVYNLATDVWTERDDAASGGYMAQGRLYLGMVDEPRVTEQRTSGTVNDYQGPAGEPILFKLGWIALTNGNPSGDSQFTELRLLTEDATEGDWEFTFTSHYDETATCTGDAEGLKEVRVWVPDDVQRTTRLGVTVGREVFQEYLSVLGLRDIANSYDGPPAK